VSITFAVCLERGRIGDRAALDDLFARWQPLLCLQARRLLGADVAARADPADVVQEALAQAYRDLGQFRGQTEGEWVEWLRRMVAGQAVKVRRQHHAEKRDVRRDQTLDERLPGVGGSGPAGPLIRQEEAARLARAIADLPPDMREVVQRRVFHQQPFDEVAGALGRSSGAARVLWTRALRRLRELLDENSTSA
jgi:RNA polymerase sigma-70 factor (ECF subfamily)